MAVVAVNETHRTFQHRFGESPSAELKFIVTLDGATPTQQILGSVGIFFGTSHPEYPYLLCLTGDVTETDPLHAEVAYRFEVPRGDTPSAFQPNPLARRDVWSFSIGGSQVPALTYIDGNTVVPLTNTAGDYVYESLTVVECEVRATIASNRPTFPLALAANVTNTINNAPFLGGLAGTWQCQGISGTPATEVVNGVEVNYWQTQAELVYRPSGWNLLLPNVGLLCRVGNDKANCVVKGLQPGDPDVAASTPQALNSDGTQKYPPGTTIGLPDILERQVYRAVNFTQFFGVPLNGVV